MFGYFEMNFRAITTGLPKIAVVIIALLLAGCGDEESNPIDGTGDLQEVRIVVVENNTDTRIADAYIIIDQDNQLSCYTPGPGGATGGDCVFMLRKAMHAIRITKIPYRPVDTTFIVTSTTSVKYFSLSNN